MDNKTDHNKKQDKKPSKELKIDFGKSKGNKAEDKKPKFNIGWVYGAIFVALILFNVMGNKNSAQEIQYSKFANELLKTNDIESLHLITNQNIVEVTLKKDAISQWVTGGSQTTAAPQLKFKIGSMENFQKIIDETNQDRTEENKIRIGFGEYKDYFSDIFSFIFPILIIIGIWMFMMRRMGGGMGGGSGGPGGIFNVGKSKAKIFDKGSNININFGDVAGLAEAKEEIEEIVSFLKSPKKYTELGGKIPKGALLVGPPGTGKTLLAKAVAGEAHVPFFSMSGSDFVEMFVGVGASRVRDLFRQAKEKSPCIIFIDEIDAIGRARGQNPNMGANDERENTLNQLLTEMDGFGDNSGVIILAATNRAEILDKALMRAGRFDRQIHVELPELQDRVAIFEVHLRPLKLDKTVDAMFLAKQTPGFSGADIANVCNEAALIAARKEKKSVGKQDFLDAVDRIIGGLEKKSKIITASEKSAIANHEAGHASVSWLLEHAHPLVKVTIVPRGKALGAAWYLPEERQLTTKDQMLDEMCATLGGRAAEDLIFGKISTGALNDLERVTKSAYAMVTYFGMSDEVGNLSYYDSSGGNGYGFTKPYSEKTAELIDKEVKVLITEQYNRAKQLISDNKEKHSELSSLLVDKEVIFSDDLVKIFGARPWKSERREMEEEAHKKFEKESKAKAAKKKREAEKKRLAAKAEEMGDDVKTEAKAETKKQAEGKAETKAKAKVKKEVENKKDSAEKKESKK
jgi:ATP-dependent metalloprotease FtsH